MHYAVFDVSMFFPTGEKSFKIDPADFPAINFRFLGEFVCKWGWMKLPKKIVVVYEEAMSIAVSQICSAL